MMAACIAACVDVPHHGFGRCTYTDINGCATTVNRIMMPTETKESLSEWAQMHRGAPPAVRPMVRMRDGQYAFWCECGTAPTPPNGEEDIAFQILSGRRRGQIILMHYECAKERSRGR